MNSPKKLGRRPRTQRRPFTPKKRTLAVFIGAGIVGTFVIPFVVVSAASYTDTAQAKVQTVGVAKPFTLEVKSNGKGDIWSAATTEATAATVNAVSDSNTPSGAESKPLIVSSSVRVASGSVGSAHILPTIKAPSTCTDTCASIYDYMRISAWWGTTANPVGTQIGSNLSVADFNASDARGIIGSAGDEQLLTLSITLVRPPIATFGGIDTTVGIVYNGQTDSTLG